MARKSKRRRPKTRNKSYRKINRAKLRKIKRKSRKRKHNLANPFITSNRVITRLSKVMKHPGEYITKDTIPFYLNKKAMDPLSFAQLGTITAHVGLDASEM